MLLQCADDGLTCWQHCLYCAVYFIWINNSIINLLLCQQHNLMLKLRRCFTPFQKCQIIWKTLWNKHSYSSAADGLKKHQPNNLATHIAKLVCDGPHNPLALSPHTAMNYGPLVVHIWYPKRGPRKAHISAKLYNHSWPYSGPMLDQTIFRTGSWYHP